MRGSTLLTPDPPLALESRPRRDPQRWGLEPRNRSSLPRRARSKRCLHLERVPPECPSRASRPRSGRSPLAARGGRGRAHARARPRSPPRPRSRAPRPRPRARARRSQPARSLARGRRRRSRRADPESSPAPSRLRVRRPPGPSRGCGAPRRRRGPQRAAEPPR